MTEQLHQLIESCLEQRVSILDGSTDAHSTARSEFRRWCRLSQWIRDNRESLAVELAFVEQPPEDRSDAPSRVLVTFNVKRR